MRSGRPMARTLARGGAAPPTPPGREPPAADVPAAGRVTAVLRHVVLFTWTDDADDARRATTVHALRRLREDVGGMSELTVSADAGLVDGNAHTVLIAEHVRPWLAARSAVQYVLCPDAPPPAGRSPQAHRLRSVHAVRHRPAHPSGRPGRRTLVRRPPGGVRWRRRADGGRS